MYKHFDVKVIREIHTSLLAWPRKGEADSELGLGCNREYQDLRYLSWKEARRVYDVETVFFSRLEDADDPDEEYDAIIDELYDEFDDHLYGLDLGVASCVAALSAAGCIPFSSCNGGFVGGSHFDVTHWLRFMRRCGM